MKIKRISSLGILLMLIVPIFAEAQRFPAVKDKRVQKIKLLESTDKEINRLFRRRIAYNEPTDVKGGVIVIRYSFGKCAESDVSDYDVPETVVVGIDFYPTIEMKVEAAKLNFVGWRLSFESQHNLPLYSYWNDEEGIKYVIDRSSNSGGTIHSIEYYPSSKFNYLKCEKTN